MFEYPGYLAQAFSFQIGTTQNTNSMEQDNKRKERSSDVHNGRIPYHNKHQLRTQPKQSSTMTDPSDGSDATVKVEVASPTYLNAIAKEKTEMLERFFSMEPMHVEVMDKKTGQPKPRCQGEDVRR